MNSLRDQRVLVLGLGHSGLAMARWCAGCGAQVTVWDSRAEPPQAAALREALAEVLLLSGELAVERAAEWSLILKSPGLAPHDERIAPLLAAARAAGIRVAGELDLFALALADLKAARGYQSKVVAITGTNGKTTTTALASLLIERSGRRVASAGNIGPTMLDTLAAALALEPVAAEEQAAAELPLPPGRGKVGMGVECGDAALSPPPQPSPHKGEGAGPEPEATAAPDDDAALITLAPPLPAAPVFTHLPEVWVLELSSFQLDGVQGFEPDAAVVLNVTQDHLDWHGSMAAYAAAKSRVYGPVNDTGDVQHNSATLMVINRDDLMVEAMVPASLMVKGGRGRAAKSVGRKVVRFGLDGPQRPGDYGLVTENGMTWLVRAMQADETIKRRQAEDDEIHLQRLMPADALRIRGRHNAANALAALALAQGIGCPLAPMLHALRDYRGEPHRVERVGRIGEVEAFDDSKGTNVGATVAALNGLGADKLPAKLVVILGGDGKGQDFTPLLAPITRYARALALIGRDAARIEAALADSGVAMQHHDSLEAATAWAFAQARSGDAVLLSPACASLDMFRNYGHRAEVFVAAVQAQAAERGEVLVA